MSLRRFDYVVPASLGAAVAALREPGSAALAGGHHLLTSLKRRETTVGRLVDLSALAELRGIHTAADGAVTIGAMTTLTGLLTDPDVRASGGPGALEDAVAALGDRQSRNRATVGGQLASGRPGNDLAAALMALDAVVSLTGPAGARSVPVTELWDGSGLGPAELITAVGVPARRGASGYARMVHRPTLEAVCGVAAAVRLTPEGRIGDCRVAAVGVTVRPMRLTSMEDAVRGTDGTGDPGEPPLDAVLCDDNTASADYRRHMAGVLASRAIGLAMNRARTPVAG